MTIDPAVVIAAMSGIFGVVTLLIRDLVADRNYWRSIALRLSGTNEKAIDVAARRDA